MSTPTPLPLSGQRVAFTGTLASMPHRQAQALVEQHGGSATEHVSKQTTMLVIGEEGWPLEADGKPSVKLQQVLRWKQEHIDIRIVRESDWLGFVGLHDQRDEVHRQYTPAMLSQLLKVPVNVIRGWARSGLIKPVGQVFRLPYFDFQEVAGARKLAELVAAGVPRREIEAGLAELQGILRDIDRPLAQLEILAGDQRLLYRDESGRLKTTRGQRVFDFENAAATQPMVEESDTPAVLSLTPSRRIAASPEESFATGCQMLDDGQLESAREAFRLCLMDQPARAEVHFHLAETLYRLNNPQGALERYHIAVELDPNYLEAWTQIGCIHAELGHLASAVEAFDVALDVHADYPDAHIHKAEVLHQLGRTAEAVPHWQQYLKFDQRGPWAASARRRLHDAGIGTGEPLADDTDDFREPFGPASSGS